MGCKKSRSRHQSGLLAVPGLTADRLCDYYNINCLLWEAFFIHAAVHNFCFLLLTELGAYGIMAKTF
jgi:hypothetical protein